MVKDLLHSDKQHTVDIDRTEGPAVTEEKVQRTLEDKTYVGHDREVHQHHYQTQVQPIENTTVNETKHHHHVAPVEHREVHHGKTEQVKQKLDNIAAGFKSTTETLPTQVSKDQTVVSGEHVHHHIHEQIIPKIHQTTIQPETRHTVIPIHEKIENEPIIHETKVLPTKTLNEFQSAGAGGNKHEHYEYSGDPLKIDNNSNVLFDRNQHGTHGTSGTHGTHGIHGTHGSHGTHGTQGPATDTTTGRRVGEV